MKCLSFFFFLFSARLFSKKTPSYVHSLGVVVVIVCKFYHMLLITKDTKFESTAETGNHQNAKC